MTLKFQAENTEKALDLLNELNSRGELVYANIFFDIDGVTFGFLETKTFSRNSVSLIAGSMANVQVCSLVERSL